MEAGGEWIWEMPGEAGSGTGVTGLPVQSGWLDRGRAPEPDMPKVAYGRVLALQGYDIDRMLSGSIDGCTVAADVRIGIEMI